MLKKLVRRYAYPLIFGTCAAGIILLDLTGLPLWPWSTLIALAGVFTVGLLKQYAGLRRSGFSPIAMWLLTCGITSLI